MSNVAGKDNKSEIEWSGAEHADKGSWIQMARNPDVKPNDFFSRLSSYWNMVIATGGMLAGFAFVITSQQIEFRYDRQQR